MCRCFFSRWYFCRCFFCRYFFVGIGLGRIRGVGGDEEGKEEGGVWFGFVCLLNTNMIADLRLRFRSS